MEDTFLSSVLAMKQNVSTYPVSSLLLTKQVASLVHTFIFYNVSLSLTLAQRINTEILFLSISEYRENSFWKGRRY